MKYISFSLRLISTYSILSYWDLGTHLVPLWFWGNCDFSKYDESSHRSIELLCKGNNIHKIDMLKHLFFKCFVKLNYFQWTGEALVLIYVWALWLLFMTEMNSVEFVERSCTKEQWLSVPGVDPISNSV